MKRNGLIALLVMVCLELPLVLAALIVSLRYGYRDSLYAAWDWRTEHPEVVGVYLILALLFVRRRNRRATA